MIVGLVGFARAGKDSVANVLVECAGYTKISFSEPLDEALIALNPVLHGDARYGDLRNSGVSYETIKDAYPEARALLQRLGTEVGRMQFGENFWVDIAAKKIPEHKRAVFTNVRYLNEAKMITDNGGLVVQVKRHGVSAVNDHSSELFASNIKTGFTIHNNGDLFNLVHEVLEKFNYWGVLE